MDCRVPGYVGQPLPNVQVKLVDEEDIDVTERLSAAGELYVRGPGVFKGFEFLPLILLQLLEPAILLCFGQRRVVQDWRYCHSRSSKGSH